VLPRDLGEKDFASYPPEAKRLAVAHIALLQQLPLSFVPLLLRELIAYDWKFPAERKDIDRQFVYLASLTPAQLTKTMDPFTQLRLTTALEKTDWVNSPSEFSEQLTAHLWATHQIDGFRTAAVEYMAKTNGVQPEDPLPVHRLGIAVIGRGVGDNSYRLFRKLRSQGIYFSRVGPANGFRAVTTAVAERAKKFPALYGHWYIDGGEATAMNKDVAQVSYAALAPARQALQKRMQKLYQASVFDPEAFRTKLAQTRLSEIGLDSGEDSVLDRFRLTLLTEGSGTQVFATTFAQWAAREALRRAQPLTLLVRFAPRQRENSMSELLNEGQRPAELDPQGSLVDADMGAYYTWLNQQRLSGASQAAFLVWFEDHQEALAIGPSLDRNKVSDERISLAALLERVA
jgi:hypothetical protein